VLSLVALTRYIATRALAFRWTGRGGPARLADLAPGCSHCRPGGGERSRRDEVSSEREKDRQQESRYNPQGDRSLVYHSRVAKPGLEPVKEKVKKR
jgi:hypothetical protein